MTSKFTKLFILTTCLFILQNQAYCSRILKVGVYQNSPIIFMDSDGAAKGFFIDILEAIAKEQSWELTYVPGAWEECLERLESGEIDLLPDIAWSDEREQIFDFNHESVFTGWGQIYIRQSSNIAGYLDLQDKTIAVLKGNYARGIIEQYLQEFAVEARFLEKNSFHEVLLAVEAGEADAGLVNRFFGELNMKNYRIRRSPLVLAPAKFYFAAPENKYREVLSAIDSSLVGMKADSNSEYFKAMREWLDFLTVYKKTPLWHYLLFGGLLILVIIGGIFLLLLRAGVRLKTSQLKRANDKLMKSDALLREMEKVAKIGGWEYDIENKTITWTAEIYYLFGVSPEKYDPNNIENDINFYEGEDRAVIESAFWNAIELGDSYDLELQFRNAQGEKLWVRTIGTPVKEGDKIVKVRGAFQDISLRKRAEEASRRNNDVIKAINKVFQETLICDTLEEVAHTCINLAEKLTGSDFGFIGEINQSGKFDTLSYGNIGWAVCKMPESEAIALSKNMLISGIWGQSILLNESLIINDPDSHPERTGVPEGHPRIKNFIGVPLKHQDRTVGLIGLANKEGCYNLEDQRAVEMLSVAFVAVMNRMKAVEALRKSEEKYRALIEGLDDGVLLLDGLQVVMINGKLKEIFNIDIDIVGKDLSEMAKEFNIPIEGELKAHFNRLRKKKTRSYYKLQLEINGKKINISIREELMTFEGRKVIRGIIRDESKLSQMEEQFRQAQKLEAVGMLAGGVAHDFNNLLTVISGNVEMAKMDLTDEESELPYYLEQITKASNRASDLTRQLLAFSRKQTLTPKVCNINDIIKNVEKMLARLVGEHIILKIDLADNLYNVYADRGNMDQVLINLAVNARDAMLGGGRISISTRNAFIDEKWGAFAEKFIPGDYIEIAFSDTGSGIPADIQDKIFDPFFTTKGIGRGTGLGLSTIFGIIEQHNGYIKCYSETGIGTTFKIYLPQHEGEIEKSAMTPLEGEMPRGSESILVVEDSEDIRNLTVAVLSRLGYQVFKAGNGKEAYSFCAMVTKPVDLILTDVIMPEMNGVEFEEYVRNIWPGTKVLFMTGYTADVLDEYLSPDKNYQFLHKPFMPQELAQKVREALDQHRL